MEKTFSDFLCAAVSGISLFLSFFICFDDSYLENLSLRKVSWNGRKPVLIITGVLVLTFLSVVFGFSPYMCAAVSVLQIGAIFYIVNYPAYRMILRKKAFLLDMYSFMVSSVFTLSVFSVLCMGAAAIALIPDSFMRLLLLSIECAAAYFIAIMMLIAGDSLFLLPASRRQKIEEVSLANNDPKYACGTTFTSGSEAIMKRLISFLEEEKAYLNPELTAPDVAKNIFTNRSYLAKTIKIHTDGNFNQLVNKYRVEHSIALFNHNPRLTVTQLAHLSGFKTTPTYSAAFRMVMNESPIEWCKYRRACLSK